MLEFDEVETEYLYATIEDIHSDLEQLKELDSSKTEECDYVINLLLIPIKEKLSKYFSEKTKNLKLN